MLIEFIGPAGSGKSYLSKALNSYLIKKNYNVKLIQNKTIFNFDTYLNSKNNLEKIKVIFLGTLFILFKLILDPFDSIKLLKKTFKSSYALNKKIAFLITYLQYTFDINNNYWFLSLKKNKKIIKIIDGSKINILHEFIYSDSSNIKDSYKFIKNSNYQNRLLIVLRCDLEKNYKRLKNRGRNREIKQYIIDRNFSEYHQRSDLVINLLKKHMVGKLFKNVLVFDTTIEPIEMILPKILKRINEIKLSQ